VACAGLDVQGRWQGCAGGRQAACAGLPGRQGRWHVLGWMCRVGGRVGHLI